MKKSVFTAALALLLAGCAQKAQETPIVYYTSPNPYETVKVEEPAQDAVIRNIILMIGDGMGLEQASCAWVLNRGKLNLDNFPCVGLSRTWATNSLITDSPAGGTALASGVKTAYNHVGTAPDGSDLPSILSKAHELGKKTGLVVTCHFADATPCDFCCHVVGRDNHEDLIADYVTCGVDYLAGGGLDYFKDKRTDGRDICREMDEAGYLVALSVEGLEEGFLPMIGILAPDNLPVAAERGDMYRRAVRRGIDLLSEAAGEKGFVMMLEGSSIDDWLHANNLEKAMEETLDFDRTIGDVLEWAASDGHTLVVVVADHATGCMTLRDGSIEDGRVGVSFASESHNGIAVPIYAWGAGSAAFTGIRENDEWGRMLIDLVK